MMIFSSTSESKNNMSRIQHARILRDHHRAEESLGLLLAELAGDPDNDYLHYEICLTYLDIPKSGKSALTHIRKAIGLNPDDVDYIAMEAHVLNQLDRHKEALEAAQRALTMDAEVLMGWLAKAYAHGGMEKWKDMETAARKGLEIYPDDPSLANALAIGLRLQGRLEESAQLMAGRLERDPENDMNLANSAWVALQAGKRDEAEEKFLAALQIDPTNEYARHGLREAYKSRSFIYRAYLSLCFRMAAVPENVRTMIMIGMFIGYRFVSKAASQIHPMLGGAVVLLWMLFVFWAHIVNSLMHAILLKDPIARHTLSPRQKWDGLIAASYISLAVILVVTGLLMDQTNLMKAGLLSFGTLLAASHIACNRMPGMIVYGGITLFATASIILTAIGIGSLFWLAVMVLFLSTWLSFISYLNQDAEDT